LLRKSGLFFLAFFSPFFTSSPALLLKRRREFFNGNKKDFLNFFPLFPREGLRVS